MSAGKVSFICGECGYKTSKWLGKCPECGQWNSFVEEVEREKPRGSRSSVIENGKTAAVPLSDVESVRESRITCGINEWDRVMGGMLPGQAVLLSGEPGIGKSTLLLTLAGRLAESLPHGRCLLYVNGEESNVQVRSRAERMGVIKNNIKLLGTSSLEDTLAEIEKSKPAVLFVDSLQTVSSERYTSLPGSVVQVRECTYQLVQLCKSLGTILFVVGHITKSGSIAGPKVVEHIVDTVLFMEVDSRGYYRVLRSLKNRFHTTDEIGFFTMREEGLAEIEDINRAFTYLHEKSVSGICIYPMLEGNRVFPVEVQALCVPTQYNYPRRTADGLDPNRLSMLTAILEKRLKLNLSSMDIFVNITNGLRIDDPALDLPVLYAVMSSYRELPIALDTAVAGEAGLTGEVRPVRRAEKRAAEMARLGLKKILLPFDQGMTRPVDRIMLLPVKDINEGSGLLFS